MNNDLLMNNEEGQELSYRALFPPEEARQFSRPEFTLPTRRIAYWSLGVSLAFSAALVVSWRLERSAPDRVFKSSVRNLSRPVLPADSARATKSPRL